DWVSSLDGAAAGLAIYEQGMAFAERRGLGGNRMWMLAESTWRLFDLGRWDEVESAADQIRRWFGPRCRGQQVVMAGTQEARLRAYRGELDRAAELMEELLPAARESKDVQTYRPALTTRALIAAQSGRPEQAAALLEELERDLEGGGYNRAYGMLEGTLVAKALGDVALAARIARVEEPFVPAYPL